MLLYGQAFGILATSTSPWWRGKYWPQITAQSTILICALVVSFASNPILIGASFFAIGSSLGITYAAALYHGISARKAMGKNTGIHESLIAAGNILGCLLGGFAAQEISPRAPYILLACLAVVSLITAFIASREHFSKLRRQTSRTGVEG
jgi:predicted MFS family arabinose efflux permease